MIAHEHRTHATLAPSSAHRFMACPGSIRMASGIADTGSVYAREGTAAHQLAEKCLKGAFPASRFLDDKIEVEGHVFTVTPAMADAVQVYLDVAEEIRDDSDEFEFEQHLDLEALVPGCHGTGDVLGYKRSARKITIADLKYGSGVAVEVEENEQELTYAAGVCLRYHNQGVDEVELIIVQPRAPHRDGPVRRWTTDVITLYEHVAALQRASLEVANPQSRLVVGDHCRFCKASGFCGELRNKVLSIINATVSKGSILGIEQPESVPFKEWDKEQWELNLVAQWLKGREAFAHAEAVAGRPPPGSKLVAKRAFRKWVDPEAAGKALLSAGADLDDLYEPPTLKSPAVVEKLLPAKVRATVMKPLARAESSGTVIAPLSDSRPAVDASAANGFEAQE